VTSDPEPGERVAAGRQVPSGNQLVLIAIGIGLASGFFSGLFGVGGGLIVVPALAVLLGLDHRRAVGTSLLAIVPAVTASLVSYAATGSVNLAVGGLLAVGAIVGAQAGVWLLGRISRRAAQWIFVGFVVVMIVQLLSLVPERGADLPIDVWRGIGLVVLGLGAGVLSALLGVGGGGVVVPVLMVWFGIGDLSAKGASLVMMLPGVASGLVANLRKQFVDVRLGLMIGAAAVVSSPLGVWVAHAIPPQPAAWLFAGFLLFVGGTMAREALRPPAA